MFWYIVGGAVILIVVVLVAWKLIFGLSDLDEGWDSTDE